MRKKWFLRFMITFLANDNNFQNFVCWALTQLFGTGMPSGLLMMLL